MAAVLALLGGGKHVNKQQLTNEINNIFKNKLENNVEQLAQSINKNLTKLNNNYISLMKNKSGGNNQTGQMMEIIGSTIDKSNVKINIKNSSTTDITSINTLRSSNDTTANLINKITTDLKNDAKSNLEFAAKLESANALQNKKEQMTNGEINNLINGVTKMLTSSKSENDISNYINTQIDNAITNRISNTANIENTVDNIFNTNSKNDIDTTCNATNYTSQIARIIGSTITNSQLDLSFESALSAVSLCQLDAITKGKTINDYAFSSDSKVGQGADLTTKGDLKVTSSQYAKNEESEKTTSIIDSFLNMLTYIGIGLIVLLVVLIVAGLVFGISLFKGKGGQPGSTQGSAPKAPIGKAPIGTAPIAKAPIGNVPAKSMGMTNAPVKRIAGLPKF